MATDKRLKELLESLEEQGGRITEVRKGWMIYPPDKAKPGVTIHKTPSDHRAWNNMLSQLRRSGFDI